MEKSKNKRTKSFQNHFGLFESNMNFSGTIIKTKLPLSVNFGIGDEGLIIFASLLIFNFLLGNQ